MNRKKDVFLMCLLCLALQASSQQSVVFSGKVMNSSHLPIPFVSIRILNTHIGAYTDSAGSFLIRSLFPGKYDLQVSAVGFATVNQEINLSANQPNEISITLFEQSTRLDGVIVTAEKKEQNLQVVPVSVTEISSRQVKDYRLWNSKDLTAIVPNLYSSDPGDMRNVTSVRGIVSSSYDPAVATYIDGVNQFSLDTYISQLYDVDRIEVLRGPQGTLYGRNAMGGVVNIISKEPPDHGEFKLQGDYGSYGEGRGIVTLKFPMFKKKLLIGASIMAGGNQGFYTNTYNNSKFDSKYSWNANYYAKWLASSSWTILLNVKQQENRNNGTFPLASSKQYAFDHPYQVDQNAITQMVDNTFNASLTADYSGRSFDFSSQTAYQSNYRYYKDPIDADFSPADAITIINNYGKPWNKVKVLTQEFRFHSSERSNSPINWTAGAYFFYQDAPNKQATHFGKDAALVGAPDTLFSILNTSTLKRWGAALYAQASYQFNPKFSLIAGVRLDYEADKEEVHGQYYKDGNPNPLFDTQPDSSANTNFSAFSPKLGLGFEASRNNRLYLTYSRGYRAGGLTALSSDPSQPPLYEYRPEYSDNIELSSKNNFLDDRLRLNLAVFYSTISNAQVPTLVLPDAITIIKNAGKLTSYGAELEMAATPFNGLELNYAFGYTHATFDSLNLAQNGSSVNLEGKRQVFTPDFTSMLAAQYRWSVSKKVSLIFRGEWFSLGQQYFDLANTISQSSYSLFNARMGINLRSPFRPFGGIECYVWGRNLADKTYISYAYDFGAVHLGNPRTFGVSLMLDFSKVMFP